jgi:hypothetical protein
MANVVRGVFIAAPRVSVCASCRSPGTDRFAALSASCTAFLEQAQDDRYPPFAYRLWHTDETQPGWRMYLIDFDESVAPSDTQSFFRCMNRETQAIVTLQDRPRMLRFFKVDQRPDRLFWQCIVNGADRNHGALASSCPTLEEPDCHPVLRLA